MTRINLRKTREVRLAAQILGNETEDFVLLGAMDRSNAYPKLVKEKIIGKDIRSKLEIYDLREGVINLTFFSPDGDFSPKIPTLSTATTPMYDLKLRCKNVRMDISRLELVLPTGEQQGSILIDCMIYTGSATIGKHRFKGAAGTWVLEEGKDK